MANILITGSSQGLGELATKYLISQQHNVVLHARNSQTAAKLQATYPDAKNIIVGDLSRISEVKSLAQQANHIGRFDSIIQNAGICYGSAKAITEDGIQEILAVNVVAPYLLAALLERPDRMIFLSSSMHRNAHNNGNDLNWENRGWNSTQAYSESKFYDLLLSCFLSQIWPATLCNSVDPGWVPTRMGGTSASDDLTQGWQTQAWLAISDEKEAQVTGKYFYHRQQQQPDMHAYDSDLQQKLINYCSQLTGINIPIKK